MRQAFLLLLVVVCGCEKASEKVAEKATEMATGTKIEKGGDKVTVQTDEGTAVFEKEGEVATIKTKDGTATFGAKELPKDFPLSVLPGSKILNTMTSRQAGQPQVYHAATSCAGPVEKVVKHYEKALKDKGLKLKKHELTSDEGKTIVVQGTTEKVQATVSILQKTEEKGIVVNVAWSAEP